MAFNNNLPSGAFFLLFTGAAFAMTMAHMPAVSVEKPGLQGLMRGHWPPKFEDALGKALPVATTSRNFWGSAEYAAFHDGRKGVVAGHNGWLFTSEEFSCPSDHENHLTANLAYIRKVKEHVATHARLAIVLIPAKARVYAGQAGRALPQCRRNLYDEVLDVLARQGIPAARLLPAMTARDDLFLKTDTHWSPMGARLAAHETAALVKGLALQKSPYAAKAGAVKEREGDLTRYIPGVPFPRDTYSAYDTGLQLATAGESQDLFGAAAPPVTLVGTSYSANRDWHFEGFLKEALQADVLNMADEGQGPFTVMDKYLETDAWKDSPPKLIVWEIPERYLLMPHGVPPA